MEITPIVWSSLHGNEFGYLKLSAGSDSGFLGANSSTALCTAD